MTRAHTRWMSVLTSAALLAAGLNALAPAPASAVPAGNELFYGLTDDDRIVSFRSDTGTLAGQVVSGLEAGDDLVGIDVHPITGLLYGLARGTAEGTDTIYTLDPVTGAATRVSDVIGARLDPNGIGMDINPVSGRLRVVSDAAQNLSIALQTGQTVVGPALFTSFGDSSANPTGIGYDNNRPGASSTTLYSIDLVRNLLLIVNPNTGGQTPVGALLSSPSPVPSSEAGLDIDGLTRDAYAVLNVNGQRGLYDIDLATGAAARIGSYTLPGVVDITRAPLDRIGMTRESALVAETTGSLTVQATRTGDAVGEATVDYTIADGTASNGVDYTGVDGTLTFAPGATTASLFVPILDDVIAQGELTFTVTLSDPTGAVLGSRLTTTVVITDNEDAGPLLHGLTTTNGLATIRSTTGIIGTPRAITGLAADDDVLGLDVRPSTGELIALTRDAAGVARLYVVDPVSAGATPLASLVDAGGAGFPLLEGTYAMDVDPVRDELRVLPFDRRNLRVDLQTGLVTAETPLSIPGSASPAAVSAAAYTDSVSGATSTRLLGIDVRLAEMKEVVPPDGGTLQPAGQLDTFPRGPVGYDIDGASGIGYASLDDVGGLSGGPTALYAITEVPPGGLTDTRLGSFELPGVEDITVATPRIRVLSAVVTEGQSATVTVQRSGDTTRAATVDYATGGGTATAGSDYTAASGTLSFAANETTRTFVVPTSSEGAFEGDESVALTLSNPTAGSLLARPGQLTITEVTPPPPPAPATPAVVVSAASQSVDEPAGGITVTVLRSSATGTGSVQYATSDGTAVAGQDYTATSGTLAFAPGETSKTLVVPVLDDALVEGAETLAVALSAPVGLVLGSPSTQTVTITSDDVEGTFSVAPAQTVAETAGTVTVAVTRASSAGAASVSYATADGTAIAGQDYTATSGVLGFAPGETTRTISVPVIDDGAVEPDEAFSVALTGGPSQTVTITSEDERGATSLSAAATPVVRWPGAAVVTGVLRDAAGAPLAGRAVTLIHKQQAVRGLAAFRPAATAVTDAQGRYRVSLRPTVNAVWQAIYLGSSTEAAAGSAYDVTKVQVAVPTVNGFGSALTVEAGSRVSVSGSVLPGPVRHPVVLQWIRPDGIVNLTPASRATARGSYVLSRTFAPGTYRLRVLGVSTVNNVASASRTITLRVV